MSVYTAYAPIVVQLLAESLMCQNTSSWVFRFNFFLTQLKIAKKVQFGVDYVSIFLTGRHHVFWPWSFSQFSTSGLQVVACFETCAHSGSCSGLGEFCCNEQISPQDHHGWMEAHMWKGPEVKLKSFDLFFFRYLAGTHIARYSKHFVHQVERLVSSPDQISENNLAPICCKKNTKSQSELSHVSKRQPNNLMRERLKRTRECMYLLKYVLERASIYFAGDINS